jgi:hypothetical protein
VPDLEFAIYTHTVATNTAGGSTVATTWTTRPINTLQSSNGSFTAPSSNQITLETGKYLIQTAAVLYAQAIGDVARHRLFNVTDSAIVGEPSHPVRHATAAEGNVHVLCNYVEITSGTKNYAVQYYVNTARATNGLGFAANVAGVSETYLTMLIIRIG